MRVQSGMAKIVYWRRELPPMSEQLEGEHEITATSDRVRTTWSEREVSWARCHDSLAAHAQDRITQEVRRLGGTCAHVLEEVVTSRRDDATEEFWLVGTYRFTMFVHPLDAAPGEP